MLIRSSVLDFFGATFEQLFLSEATFWIFASTFEQLFEKLRATFWEISSNFWKALWKTLERRP